MRFDLLTTYINFARLMVERDRKLFSAYRGTDMADFKGLADRFKTLHEADKKEADVLAARLDEYEAKRPEVVDKAHSFVKQKKLDMEALERDLAQLSNAVDPTPGG